MHRFKSILAMLLAAGLAACATQGAMTVDSGGTGSASPKYRNAIAVRTVSGGQAMNIMTVPGVPNEPFKAALESSLAAKGYLAGPGAAKYYIDAEIKDLEQPVIGLDYDVTASVTYKVSGAGPAATYPISTKGSASFSDSPIGADRIRIANERAMQENIRAFLLALK
ncbi:MAG TPA: hypothetical protein VFB45_03480 [Pseudolabrys sp.]|nr:hypothetical protein [Pseudolabrys sp.]